MRNLIRVQMVGRVHLNAGKFDLENSFFLELATSEEWVSTKVCLWFGTIITR